MKKKVVAKSGTKKSAFIPFAVLVVLGLIMIFLFPPSKTVARQFDPLNTTYTIDGLKVALTNGLAQTEAAPGSASKIITRIFGGLAVGDLNSDGRPDASFLIERDPGGSGSFYYAAVALNTPAGAEGSNAVLLGDRIAPQSLEIRGAQVIANYAERIPGEPMTARPSLGVSKYMTVRGSVLEANAVSGAGGPCGGNMLTAPTCAYGYHCAPRSGSNLPFGDVGGICARN